MTTNGVIVEVTFCTEPSFSGDHREKLCSHCVYSPPGFGCNRLGESIAIEGAARSFFTALLPVILLMSATVYLNLDDSTGSFHKFIALYFRKRKKKTIETN